MRGTAKVSQWAVSGDAQDLLETLRLFGLNPPSSCLTSLREAQIPCTAMDRAPDGAPYQAAHNQSSSLLSVHHSVEVPAVGNPFQLVFAGVLEGETRSRHEVFNRL